VQKTGRPWRGVSSSSPATRQSKVDAFLKRNEGLVIYKPVKTDELVRMITLVMNRNAETSNQ